MADSKVSIWRQEARPWWAPDAQGFVVMAVIAIAAVSLFYRMVHPSEVNDKLLDTMLTIIYGTALVAIINYLFGSSRGSQAKDDTQTEIMKKLALNGAAQPVSIQSWWDKLTAPERKALEDAAATDARVAKFVIAAKAGTADAGDLAYVATKGFLTQTRAGEIATA